MPGEVPGAGPAPAAEPVSTTTIRLIRTTTDARRTGATVNVVIQAPILVRRASTFVPVLDRLRRHVAMGGVGIFVLAPEGREWDAPVREAPGDSTVLSTPGDACAAPWTSIDG